MALSKKLPEFSVLNDLLEYDNGLLRWKYRDISWFRNKHYQDAWNSRQAGQIAGSINARGYVTIDILSNKYKAHRIVWTMHNRIDIDGYIDHINGNTSDNRIENLRLADESQSSHNVKKPSTNTSGVKGVHFDRHQRKWRGQITVHNKKITKRFVNISDAETWVTEERKKLRREFANNGSGCVILSI